MAAVLLAAVVRIFPPRPALIHAASSAAIHSSIDLDNVVYGRARRGHDFIQYTDCVRRAAPPQTPPSCDGETNNVRVVL